MFSKLENMRKTLHILRNIQIRAEKGEQVRHDTLMMSWPTPSYIIYKPDWCWCACKTLDITGAKSYQPHTASPSVCPSQLQNIPNQSEPVSLRRFTFLIQVPQSRGCGKEATKVGLPNICTWSRTNPQGPNSPGMVMSHDLDESIICKKNQLSPASWICTQSQMWRLR